MATTKYLILRRDGSDADYFHSVASGVEANSAAQAIRQAAAKAQNPEGVWVAVPASNWTEEPVSVVNRDPILRIGGEQVTLEEAIAEEQQIRDEKA